LHETFCYAEGDWDSEAHYLGVLDTDEIVKLAKRENPLENRPSP
jgi:hypothetical protein